MAAGKRVALLDGFSPSTTLRCASKSHIAHQAVMEDSVTVVVTRLEGGVRLIWKDDLVVTQQSRQYYL